MQACRAQRLHRQEIGEQRPVSDIDDKAAAQHVRAARKIVALQQPPGAGVLAGGDRLAREVGNVGGVPQAQIEALRTDRGNDMGGLSDEHYAPMRELFGPLDGQRK